MGCRILTVSPDRDFRDFLKETLEGETDYEVDYAKDEAWAREKKLMNKQFHLVITDLAISQDGSTPPVRETTQGLLPEDEKREEGGLSLVKWMRRVNNVNKDTPCIILTPRINEHLTWAIKEVRACEQLVKTADCPGQILKRAKEILEAMPPPEPRLDVQIFLDQENLQSKRAKVIFGLVNFPPEKETFFHPNPDGIELTITMTAKQIEDLINRSNSVTDFETWQSSLETIGRELMSKLNLSDPHFMTYLNSLMGQTTEYIKTRIQFIIDERIHPLALEAIFGSHPPGGEEDDYWMLYHPIYRTIRQWTVKDVSPLFHDQETRDGPLNVLIIESPTEGVVELKNRKQLSLENLTYVHEECDWLRNHLRQSQPTRRVKIGEVRVISKDEGEAAFYDKVQDALWNGTWHIVHYGGHSYQDKNESDSPGYVVFPGPYDQPQSVRIDELGDSLRNAKTRLVFLSSCTSSNVGFVSTLAHYNIPTIIGFRWKIDDRMAFEYTKAFYDELLKGDAMSVEYAFAKARKNIHDRFKDNTIWASPVLITQYLEELAH